MNIRPPKRSRETRESRREKLTWLGSKPIKILSLDGGGTRGIFTSEVLAELEKLSGCPGSIGSYFDMIAGTSVGGIIALALGAGFTGKEIGEQIKNGVGDVFAFRQRRSLRLMKPKYSRHALAELAEEILADRTLNDSNRMLCIPSVEGEYNEPYIFKTCHHPDFKKDWREKMVKIALATSAAPTFFPSLADKKYSYVDGGIFVNDPIMVALVDVLACFQINREEIKILSIGCATKKEMVTTPMKNGGMIAWRRIMEVLPQIASHHAQGQAGLLLGRNRIVRISPEEENRKIALDDWRSATRELPGIAARYAKSANDLVMSEFLQTRGTEYRHFYPDSNRTAIKS